ncbi:DUF6492 family protein [Naasia sp. SYSU D00948]|uniref:DUF6492 family protein n=1 Tax=Naasia sp. SYSU D00948 TaxID=2817379 RepID=UPI001B314AE0|nr:DUF6492 family protein [Naasia sp. SYSU D00948]
MPDQPLTLVSVGFEAEYPLLRLQARSLARYLEPADVRDILLIDNGASPMPQRVRDEILAEYGPLASLVTILRPDEITAGTRGVGWSTQQVLKLAVAHRVSTDFYVVLDAKNHLVGPLSPEHFRTPDGRLRVPSYSFATHPLRKDLEHVLRYLSLDPAGYVPRFTATVTPFALRTDLVRALIADIERRTGRPFAKEFLRNELTEFFLYSGWIIARGPGLEQVYDLDMPASPALWPKAANEAGVRAAIGTVEERSAPFFAVHRRALAGLPDDGAALLAQFWASRALFPSVSEAQEFISAFRVAFDEQARRQRRRDLPKKLLAAPRKIRRRVQERLAGLRG